MNWFFKNMSSGDMDMLNNFNKNMDIVIQNVNMDETKIEKQYAANTFAALRSGLLWSDLDIGEMQLLEKHISPSQLEPYRTDPR